MRSALLRQIGVILALALVAAILWIDIATGLWQDYVILSGLAAGVVTFVLTALIVDRVIARSTHERWAPVTRLAMSDILYALADEDLSEIAHGKIVPRQCELVRAGGSAEATLQQIAQVRLRCVAERQRLATALAAWSTFLASSADAADVLDNTAKIAERLDMIRDAALQAEQEPSAERLADLNRELELFNDAVQSLVTELRRLIDSTNRISRRTTGRDESRNRGAGELRLQ